MDGANAVRPVKVGGVVFDLPMKYEVIKLIGQGTYGVVCSAKDLSTNRNVAIKKIPGVFRNGIDAKRALRETKLMCHFNHGNIVGIIDILKPPNYDEFTDLYLVYELMEADLSKIISTPQCLSDDHIQFFVFQILKGLHYVHSAGVLHRDLKPSNLLVNSDCHLKIADFGLARYQDDGLLHLTEYVATRWYRAPEVILSWQQYTNAIDIWSVGCIMAELYLRQPLFQGRDFMHQIKRITDILGSPTERDLQCVTNPNSRDFLLSLGQKPSVPFKTFLPNANPLAVDLLTKMLKFNPIDRIGVEDALRHPYFTELSDDQSIVGCPSVFQDFEFEKMGPLPPENVKQLLWNEMARLHPEANEEEMVRQQQKQIQEAHHQELQMQQLQQQQQQQQQQPQQQQQQQPQQQPQQTVFHQTSTLDQLPEDMEM